MKSSNKSSIVTGIILLAISAVFSISLILQPLDFGIGGPGHNNVFFLLGNIIFTVYGFSSILIPVFLFIAGISCFATKWTARRSMRLLTAILPFFTAAITENICRSILALGKSDFTTLKLVIAIITGLMLMIIEILGAGLIADKVNEHIYAKGLMKRPEQNETDLSKNNHQEGKSEGTDPIFDDALEEISREPESVKPESSVVEETSVVVEETSVQESSPEPENFAAPQETLDDSIMPFEEADETPAEEEKNPSSIITLDEYAALTNFDDIPVENDTEEELEWPNLPKAPETLPPEYSDEIFEDDPALEFPPKEPAEDEVNAFEDSIFDADINQEPETPPADFSDQIQEENFPAETEYTDDEELQIEAESQKYQDFSADIEFEEETEEETPYSATKYIDTVVENPSFPHKIIIREGESEEEEPEEKKFDASLKPSPFSSKISLDDEEVVSEEVEIEDFNNKTDYDDLDSEISNFEEISREIDDFAKNPEENFQNQEEFTEKDTEPEPVFQEVTEETFSEAETETESEQQIEPSLDESFFDIDINDDEAVENAKNADSSSMGFSTGVSSVFSEMEADIRRNAPKPIKPAITAVTDEEDFSDSKSTDEEDEIIFEENQDSQPVTTTNLTADDLSDFFDAQSRQNAPVTKQIMGNEPKTNRAAKKGPYVIPSDLLTAYKDDQYWVIDQQTKDAAQNLTKTLSEFNIEAQIIGIKKGPVVTMFEILPAAGVKLSKIVALQDNIALALAAQSVRIVAPIPGKQAVGIEVPNRHRSIVGFREMIEMDLPEWKKMSVPVILGKDILGKAQLIDLVKTPHMLIAGATGSGKSVCVNSLILSILYKRSYKDVKLILVDPKVVELKLYNNIPHLLTPVITEPKKALQALQYCLCEMERRYALLDGMGVRDISNYNQKIKEQKIATEKLPYIVVIIDEFADLMATSGRELESTVARLTAMSRAVGIHLVLATQRPSVNVITGLIKANIPTRIAFMVSSRTDSNIIIDSVGAEKLLGRGDMLYASATDPAPVRIQGTFVSDQEVEDVVKAVKEYGEPDYIDDEIFIESDEDVARDLFGQPMDDEDPLYDQALEIVVQAGKASASYLQRRLSIGYNRAARLVEEMEERGIVGPANGSKPREIIHIP